MSYASRMPRSVRLLSGEEFETKICLSAISFVPHDIILPEADEAHSMYAADLDGDGDVDVLSASHGDNKIAWYENIDGMGRFGRQKVIGTGSTTWVHAADVDGDGDVDVLSAGGKFAWYENTDGKGSFGRQRVIAAAAGFNQSVFAADLDGDDDVDLVSRIADGRLAWFENIDGRSFGPRKVIDQFSTSSLFVADLDGDGDSDVVSAFVEEGKKNIAWYENTDGKGRFGPQKVITTVADTAPLVYAADVDGDDDMDVLLALRNGKIAWYENTDGKGSFGRQQVISTVGGSSHLHVVDIDGDSDVDVLAADGTRIFYGQGKIALYENTDGKGTFGPEKVITTEVYMAFSVFAEDVDGDGDMDVLSASHDDKIAWYENTDGKGNIGPQKLISQTAAGARSVYAADLDSDGDVDVLSASSALGSWGAGRFAWYENIDGKGSFGHQQVITTEGGNATSVFATDLDGDGDVDVLLSSSAFPFGADKIAWYENINGKGEFGLEKVIAQMRAGGTSAYATDVDGDGDKDVLSASRRKIGWYENTDGKGSFGPQRVIQQRDIQVHVIPPAIEAESVYAADVDGDGDMDVLSAGHGLAWYENTDAKGSFGDRKIITRRKTVSAYTGDVDGDGDVDVLAASYSAGRIAWHENTDGRGTFGAQKVITTNADGAQSVHTSDVDGDGDLDVLSASSIDGKIAWYENTDGTGRFGGQQVITTAAVEAQSVFAADFDSDGDVDILSADGDKVAWYENLPVQPGDANRDFQFNQIDIVQVLQAAKYLTAKPATFEEGDWNGDGIFDQLDIAEALQTGNYLQGPHAASGRATSVIQVTGSDDVHVELVNEQLLSDLVFAVL